MTDFTIPELTAGAAVSATDLLEAWQGADPSVKITVLALAEAILGVGSAGIVPTPGNVNIQGVVSTTVAAGSGALTLLVGSGLGPLKISTLPTADPHVLHEVWNNAGVLTISAG